MRHISFPSALHALIAAAATVLLASCTSDNFSSIAPISALTNRELTQNHVGFYACPATGPLAYVSDFNNSIINVYAGKFAGQGPCAQLTSQLLNPGGLYVDGATHDLAQRNGAIYFTDLDKSTGRGALWHVSCPAGACGSQMQVGGVSFQFPGGMVFDSTGDLLVTEESGGTADTFELPNPVPATFQLQGYPMGMAISTSDHHWFVADSDNNDAAEYAYPSGTLIGTVPGNSPGGYMIGIAVDP